MSCDMTADRDYTSPTPTDMFDHYLPKAVLRWDQLSMFFIINIHFS